MRALSIQQVGFFRHFGFLHLPGWLATQMPMINEEFERLMDAHVVTNSHDGTQRTMKWQMIDSSEPLAALIDRDDIGGLFSDLLGEDWQYVGSAGSLYAGNTGWHTDDFCPHKRVKIGIYLDPTSPGAGGLSVMPLSQQVCRHVTDLHIALGMSRREIGVHGSEVPAHTISTVPGDVVVFDQNILHSSWGGGPRRRMISINAHAAYAPDELNELRSYVEGLARFNCATPFGRFMTDTGSPDRRTHLNQVIEVSDRLPSLVRTRLERGDAPARDILPDLSDNEDVEIALAEYERDAAYVSPSMDEGDDRRGGPR